MKALDKLREISKTLSTSGIESVEKEAEIIVRQSLDISIADIYKDNPEISEERSLVIEGMVSRRAGREPLQYILGHTDFLGLKILVGKGVLIPRPETEIMAEHAIKTVRSQKSKVKSQESGVKSQKSGVRSQESGVRSEKQPTSDARRPAILDLCTGSGCLALALAKEFPETIVYGTDISETALKYANENAGVNGIDNVKFLKGHLFDPLKQIRFFDLIISNPPYIRTDDIKSLQSEIRDWEPVNALDGGADGLDLYREIIPSAKPFLAYDGILMLEIGAGCSDEVQGLFERSGYSEIEVLKDYAGFERIIHAKWTK